MTDAVFLDYTGTVTQEGGPDIMEMADRVVENSSAKDIPSIFEWWFRNLRVLEQNSYGASFISEEEITGMLLKMAEQEFGLRENLEELVQLNRNFWMYAPVFSDVKPFLEQCGKTVYLITNNSAKYVRICLKRNGLHVNGIISGDMVKAYKPHKELFEKALEVSGCSNGNALMIGDSISSDVEGAQAAGMNAVLIDRKKKVKDAPCKVIYSLNDALRLL